ncbi:MAG: hypothetical protein ACR2K5_11025 [Pseudolabrys sp.]
MRRFARRSRRRWGRARRATYRLARARWFRRTAWTLGGTIGVATVLVLAVWWRLASGPIELDMATPWLAWAIDENFGSKHSVTVGGTQLERDENGGTALRMRDIVVRDADGVVVASAPKAEVGLSGASLFTGHMRAQSLNLVGAEMAVRIEADGHVTVFAGANSRPIASAPASALPKRQNPESTTPVAIVRGGLEDFSGLLAWIDAIGVTGLDGHDLHELGLKNGNLTVDDQRNGKHWTFSKINVSLTRPAQGGVIFRLASEDPARPWELSAALRPLADGLRAVGIEARKVSANDLLLALRLGEGFVESDLPLSASLRGEFAPDGTLQAARGQIVAEGGYVRDPQNVASALQLDHADIRFNWDGQHRALIVPFQIQTAGSQITLEAHIAPDESNAIWSVNVVPGDPVIDPVIFSAGKETGEQSFAFNRATISARVDLGRQRIDLDQAELGRNDVRPGFNVGAAINGSLDYSGTEPRLAFGVAGTRMPAALVKRLWPIFIATPVRSWVEERISAGTVERLLIAGSVALPALTDPAIPIPDDGLSIDLETSGTTLQPIPSLPPIRDADLLVHLTGRTANIALGRGTIEVGAGRRLSITSGVFEVPDTHPRAAPATARFRIDGSLPAAATLLAIEPLRSAAGIVLDPASSRGTLSAQASLDLVLAHDRVGSQTNYAVSIDLSTFAADRVLMGQKLEAQNLHVVANSSGYQVKGDVKLNGIAGALDFRKATADTEADLALQATLDESARRRIGIDFGPAVTGSVPIKLTGRVGQDDKPSRLTVDADFTPVRVDNLLPGWVKPAGKAARVTFALTKDARSTRFDDLTIDGQGALAKGSVELDSAGDLVTANFPVFGLSEGDRAALKVDRGSDRVFRAVMRGDVYDGRLFVKSTLGNAAPPKGKTHQPDFDLDIKIGAVLGHNGEALRGLDLKLSRRGGHIRNFNLNAKIGRDAALIGDIRPLPKERRPVIYLETDDAGSLFRFTDTYPRIFGGQMWVAMDPPSLDNLNQLGQLNIRNFVVRGEPALERVLAGASSNQPRAGVEFSELRTDFTRQPGRMLISGGVVRGPQVGVTVDGQIDYARDEVRMKGTFVPLYAINNMFGQIPIVGLFLGGGSNEGLLGITYEAVGPPSAPRITVNPMSAVAPGMLRKLLPTPGMFDPDFAQPKTR